MEFEWKNASRFPRVVPDVWSIACRIPANATGGLFRAISPAGDEILAATLNENVLEIRLHYDAREVPLRLRATVVPPASVILSAMPNRVALMGEGRVLDEEWPLGVVPFADAECEAAISVTFSDSPVEEPAFCKESFTNIEMWRPAGENTNVGDCMPYSDGELYRVYYLFDRRHHKSKWGLGAHQWAQVSSKDLVHWETHPMAIGIDEQFEGSICTGSVIRNGNTYFAFYAVRMSDYSPARLTWATGTDGDHFTKSGKYITLKEPYESVSARDPKVFRTDDGTFHMLVTTSIAERNVGALAHLVSDDLLNWKQLEPFLVLDIADQPECTDYFRFGDWYYLVYSNFGRARWHKSRFPLGPWEAPENNLVAAQNVGVPKAAVVHGRLIFTGFSKDGKGYGGNFILYEAIPAKNGDLRFRQIHFGQNAEKE